MSKKQMSPFASEPSKKITWKKGKKPEIPGDPGDLRRSLNCYKNVFGFDMVELINGLSEYNWYPCSFLNYATDELGVEGADKLFGFPDWVQV